MGRTTSMWTVGLSMAALGVAADARADEQGERIRKAMDRLAPSIVRVHYSFETTKSSFRVTLEDSSGGSREKEGEGVCIGLVVNDAGLVLIGGHVFPDPYSRSSFSGMDFLGQSNSPPKNFRVVQPNGEMTPANLVARDEDLNVAYLQVDSAPPAWKPIAFDAGAALQVGDPFLVVTFLEKKYDYQASFDTGRVSGVAKGQVVRWLQNSVSPSGIGPSLAIGAPVVALDNAKLVGVIAQPRRAPPKEVESSGLNVGKSREMSFSVSLNQSTPQILPGSSLEAGIRNPVAIGGQKGWIGIEELQPLTKTLALTFKRDEGEGAIVSLVGRDSPAEKSGVLQGDLLAEVDGKDVEAKDEDGVRDVLTKIRKSAVGSTLTLKVVRGGQEKEIAVPVAAAPKSIYEAETFIDEVFGVTVKEITYDLVQRKNLDAEDQGGVIVQKVPIAGLFSLAGLQTDDILLGVNDKPITDIASFKAAVGVAKTERKKEVLVKLKRGADTRFVKIQPDWK
ncbi:MAG: PDZ domain-containing protein [Planctomycetes bacterium]|nr:PDZ domain-containing protein [Planctomycetota bacterium]MBI3845602.1 PDZ domain-containing protein [Planctomycetota bacterium]